jgi:ketosteroid isomerase-like protein
MRPVSSLAVLLLSAALVSTSGCARSGPATAEELLHADSAFSALSVREGSAFAFHAYMAEDGRVLPRAAAPVGREFFTRLRTLPPDGSVLTWEPLAADIAASGDLGYTYGQYTETTPDSSGRIRKTHGYYVTVWKRQDDGSWKFVFDTGNQLPGGSGE